MGNDPQRLTRKEWRELSEVAAVRDGYGLEGKEDKAAFSGGAYAVKFNYVSDGPGYAGELFVLLRGDPEIPPMVFTRHRGELKLVDLTDC